MLWCYDLQLGLLWPCLLIDSRVCTPAIRSGVGSLRRPNFPCSALLLFGVRSVCDRCSRSLLRCCCSDPYRFERSSLVTVQSSMLSRVFFFISMLPIDSLSPSACGRSLLRLLRSSYSSYASSCRLSDQSRSILKGRERSMSLVHFFSFISSSSEERFKRSSVFVVSSVQASMARILLLVIHRSSFVFIGLIGMKPIPSLSPSACSRRLLHRRLFWYNRLHR